MPMENNGDIRSEMQDRAKEAVAVDGRIVPGIPRTEISSVGEYGDFEYWAQEMYEVRGKAPGTVREFYNAVSSLERFIEQSDTVNCEPTDIDERDAKKYKNWIETEVEPSTAKSYINNLDTMANFYLSKGYYPGNPFNNLADGINTSNNRDRSSSFQMNDRITVDDSRLREAIRSTHGSQKIVLLAILVKTGVRISECVNLDWEDININHSLADDILPEPRFEVSDMTDTIYVSSEKTGNKREVSSWIPIDGELKRLLLWHALTRERRFQDQNPVLMSDHHPQEKPSDRLRSNTAWRQVVSWAAEQGHGWYDSSRHEKKSVTPHWFRAKFTTYMSTRLESADDLGPSPKDIVKGLRGDVAADIVEDYRFRDNFFSSYIRPRQFKIGLEGM